MSISTPDRENESHIASFIIAASIGTVLGAYLSQYVDGKKLQKYFGYFLLGVAALILFQNRGILEEFKLKKAAGHNANYQLKYAVFDLR